MKPCPNCKRPITLPHWKYCDNRQCQVERQRIKDRKRKGDTIKS